MKDYPKNKLKNKLTCLGCGQSIDPSDFNNSCSECQAEIVGNYKYKSNGEIKMTNSNISLQTQAKNLLDNKNYGY